MVSQELTAALLTSKPNSFYCRDEKCDMYIKEKKKMRPLSAFLLAEEVLVFSFGDFSLLHIVRVYFYTLNIYWLWLGCQCGRPQLPSLSWGPVLWPLFSV